MFFKNREEAGRKLAEVLKRRFKIEKDKFLILSLLRGGWVVGRAIEKQLKIPHLPLPVAKIPSPYNPEYGLGALCFDKVFIHDRSFSEEQIRNSLKVAREKFKKYLEKFNLKEEDYEVVKGRNVFIVDDGVATGSSAEAAALFAKDKGAIRVILAAPVAPEDFSPKNFDEAVILHKDPYFSAVSQFYEDFSPVEESKITMSWR